MAKTTAKTYWRNYYLVKGENAGGTDWESETKANWYRDYNLYPTLYRIKITMKDNQNVSDNLQQQLLHDRPNQSPENRRSVWQ